MAPGLGIEVREGKGREGLEVAAVAVEILILVERRGSGEEGDIEVISRSLARFRFPALFPLSRFVVSLVGVLAAAAINVSAA